MKYISIAVLFFFMLSSSEACPSACSCFGYNGEWIADCARSGLITTEGMVFDTETTEILLQYNQLSVLDDASFKGLANLKHLYLQSNKLTALPDGMFTDLTALQSLRVNGNKITDLGENKFSMLKELVVFYAHNNEIREIKQNTFSGLDSLRHLSIAMNPQLTVIHEAALGLNLTSLDIGGSAVTNLKPEHFDGNEHLYKVYMYDIKTLNCNEELIPFLEWLDENPNLSSGRVTMKCAEPPNLRGESLSYVSPDNIVADGDCPDTCACFDGIVDCSTKGLDVLPTGFAPDTEEIFLPNNSLGSLNAHPFSHIENLQYLYLHGNELTSLHSDAFVNVAHTLKQLTLQNNQLNGTLSSGPFRSMRALQVLNLNGNSLSAIGSGAFSDMMQLVQLSILDNKLTDLDEDVFKNLLSLKYLGLANNELTSIPDMPNSDALYFIDFSGNPLTAVPSIPSTVERVVIRDGQIASLTKEMFIDASMLMVLDLTGNKISTLEEDVFSTTTNLQQLSLGKNSFVRIDDDTFASAGSLTFLDLRDNSMLTSISANAFFAQRKTLTRLLLGNCGLTTLSGATLSMMEQSSFYADLAGNPWVCDCRLRELGEYVADNPSKVSDAVCALPEEEEDKSLAEADYEKQCTSDPVSDESRALVMGLTISLAIVLFIAVTGLIVWQSGKSGGAKGFSTPVNGESEAGLSARGTYKNRAYENAL